MVFNSQQLTASEEDMLEKGYRNFRAFVNMKKGYHDEYTRMFVNIVFSFNDFTNKKKSGDKDTNYKVPDTLFQIWLKMHPKTELKIDTVLNYKKIYNIYRNAMRMCIEKVMFISDVNELSDECIRYFREQKRIKTNAYRRAYPDWKERQTKNRSRQANNNPRKKQHGSKHSMPRSEPHTHHTQMPRAAAG